MRRPDANSIVGSRDKPLFTPGPLTTSRTVKSAMLRDLGSRDTEFVAVIADVRARLLALAGARPETHAAIPMQGSGTFGLEAVVASGIPAGGKLLVAVHGAYGKRLVRIAEVLGVPVVALTSPEDRPVDPDALADALREDSSITHVSCCHCETTSGVINPIQEIGGAVHRAGRSFFLDAMSTFGAVPLDVVACHVDYMVSSSNKCIEGVPGFSFVVARLEALQAAEGAARSLSLDLLDQHRGLEASGQFRFTPPTHAMLAFQQALVELEQEGGVEGRAARYQMNHETLMWGMREIGFETLLAPEDQGPIITSFLYPEHPRWDFEEFYGRLNDSGYVIYPGKVGSADCFRVGSIGRIFPADVEALLAAIRRHVTEMGVALGRTEA